MEDKVETKYYVVRDRYMGWGVGPTYVIQAASEKEAAGRSDWPDSADMRSVLAVFDSEEEAIQEANYLNTL